MDKPKPHKVNFLVDADLFDRFEKVGKGEYRTYTNILTDLMMNYVKEKERERDSARVEKLAALVRRLSDLVFSLSKAEQMNEGARVILGEVANLMLTLSGDPSECDNPKFLARLTEVERSIGK